MEPLKQLTEPLLSWYGANARDLPWRRSPDAYRVWVSEIMLQQTRVAAVLGYYARFLEAFPTVEALAGADEGQLMKLWEGLGYYSRARNLQKAARVVTEQLGGRFPETYEGLMALPGIGDYTAGAILSIAFGQRVPAVDGNVLRLAARITGSRADVTDMKVRRAFRAQVLEAMPEAKRSGAYNQALMDLGATVCLPNGEPLCESCPARDFCVGHLAGCARELPVRAPKRKRRVEERTVLVLLSPDGVALRRRPDTGLLAGLWEFPNVEGKLDEAAAGALAEQWGLEIKNWCRRVTARHIFTHVEWHMTGYVLHVQGRGPEDFVWSRGEALASLAVPSAFARFLAEAREELQGQQ